MAYVPNLGGGAYEKNPGWSRSPSVGGGLQWNPQYGWQRRQTIEAGLASGKPMEQWGMAVQNQGDWRKYFPGSRTDAELRSMGLLGQGKNPANQGYKQYKTAGGWYDYSKAPGQATATPGPIVTPGAPGATPSGPSIQPVRPPSAVPPPVVPGLDQAKIQQRLQQRAAGGAMRRYGMGEFY